VAVAHLDRAQQLLNDALRGRAGGHDDVIMRSTWEGCGPCGLLARLPAVRDGAHHKRHAASQPHDSGAQRGLARTLVLAGSRHRAPPVVRTASMYCLRSCSMSSKALSNPWRAHPNACPVLACGKGGGRGGGPALAVGGSAGSEKARACTRPWALGPGPPARAARSTLHYVRVTEGL
jgi:hypothetical protein